MTALVNERINNSFFLFPEKRGNKVSQASLENSAVKLASLSHRPLKLATWQPLKHAHDWNKVQEKRIPRSKRNHWRE